MSKDELVAQIAGNVFAALTVVATGVAKEARTPFPTDAAVAKRAVEIALDIVNQSAKITKGK